MTNETLKDWREKVRWPWDKRPVFQRSSGHSGEIIAVVISSLALLVSVAATVGTWRQTNLMKEQLTAFERNTGSLKISEALVRACRAIKDGPVRARKWKIFTREDGRPGKIPIVEGLEFKISLQQREAYANALEDRLDELGAVGLYRAYAEEDLAEFFDKTISQTMNSLSLAIDVVDDHRHDLDYVRLRAIGEACSDSMTNTGIDFIGPGILKERTAIWLDPFTRKILTPIPDEDAGEPSDSSEPIVSVDP